MKLLIDGSNILYRSYYIGTQRPHITSTGKDVSCIFLFLSSIRRYIKTFNVKTSDIYIAWDKKLSYPSTNFRKDILGDEYKAGRDKDKSDTVHQEEDLLVPILKTLGIRNMFPYVLEADDVIAWLSKKLTGNKLIISVDRDLLQLISSSTSFYDLNKKEIIDLQNFKDTMEIELSLYLKYRAIRGDTSDNIRGLRGFGPVKAKKLARNWNLSLLNESQQELIDRNIKLMDLTYGIKQHPEDVESYEGQLVKLQTLSPNLDKFKKLCQLLEFQSFLNDFDIWVSACKESPLKSVLDKLS